ncbi:hypothetical protein [Flavobacterium sp. TBRC 19031]|uniref:hypothetical protein n=1 Tax=Flavobacterium mekongense TaxID=3379707 RepID=UPI00399C442B
MKNDVFIIASVKIIPNVGRFFFHTGNRPTIVCNPIIQYNRSETIDESLNTIPTNTNKVLISTSAPIQVNTNTTIHSPTLYNSSFIVHSPFGGGKVKTINPSGSATHSGSLAKFYKKPYHSVICPNV